MYTYDFIEEEMIVRTLSHTYSKDGSHSHSWNDKYRAFEYQLYQWDVDTLFKNSDEVIIVGLEFYAEDWQILNINNNSRLLCTMFNVNYSILDL